MKVGMDGIGTSDKRKRKKKDKTCMVSSFLTSKTSSCAKVEEFAERTQKEDFERSNREKTTK